MGAGSRVPLGPNEQVKHRRNVRIGCEARASAVLQWAQAQGSLLHEKSCSRAAENGHLAVLQWARAEWCPKTKIHCKYAAKSDFEKASAKRKLAMLQWINSQD